MICLDNSQWMRNGDFSPTRLQAQTEAINYIADIKIKSNRETIVGVLSMAGHRIEVHSSPTRDIGKIMNSLGKTIQPYGTCNFIGGMKTAQLALKKRVNKHQQQRIIIFVGSPIEDEIKDLEKLGKQLKKNSVVVDIINFGVENETNGNPQKLEAFKNAVNSNADNSHLVNVPTGPRIVLLGYLLTTAVMTDNASYGVPGVGSGPSVTPGANRQIDINSQDKQMDMAIRMSMEDERKRLQEEKKKQEDEKNKDDGNEDVEMADDGDEGDDSDDVDAADLKVALEMSLKADVNVAYDGGDGGDVNKAKENDEVKKTEQIADINSKDGNENHEDQEDEDDQNRNELLCNRDFLEDIMKDIEMDEGDVEDILSKFQESDDEQNTDPNNKKDKDT